MGWLLVLGAIAAILGGIYLTLGITYGKDGRVNFGSRGVPLLLLGFLLEPGHIH